MISEGDADYCLAGASDASIVPLMLSGYHQMRALDPERLRPFDSRRRGFQVGEGAGIVFLESLESARARNAKVYAEIAGHDMASDSFDAVHFDENDGGLGRSLGRLLTKMGSPPGEIDYVNLHGTGTPKGDIYETAQIKKAFGKAAYRVPMSATKSMTGHMLGASGAASVIACALAMEEQFIPPTAGLERQDPACDLDYTPEMPRHAAVRKTVSVSMGFGGQIAVIGLQKI
jgi:3-oxoacyl-[acyl-carrier-protein] synthase II